VQPEVKNNNQSRAPKACQPKAGVQLSFERNLNSLLKDETYLEPVILVYNERKLFFQQETIM